MWGGGGGGQFTVLTMRGSGGCLWVVVMWGGSIHSGGCGGPQWWYGEATIHIPCVVYTQAFLLDGDSIKHIMQLYPVVEERLWRVSGIRTAMHLLPQLPEYQVRDGGWCVCVCVCVCV